MAELIWGEESLRDMEDIYDYIARNSPFYARNQLERIYKSAQHLFRFPELGRHLPEFQYLPHREIIVDNYRIIYRYDADSDKVIIVSIVHGRRIVTQDLINRCGDDV